MPDSEELSSEQKAEILRKKSRYRDLILSGRLVLPHARAAQLLGPDCLYHLYSPPKSSARKRRASSAQERRKFHKP
jgi:hypothetical protein